ncbi:MAG: tRNA pseudouridine(38-40) synthase TruA [Alphaproteobacteria bacterium]|jgi:tRNA pseudouridine38-40 synthase|nr:tRNA pseudouridine(38-40) synthase TruA [Alphaproteobacteria bacterium]MBT7943064.1 tRNA pseudouridine(38-40) synthase TruA [Alphaproteobacteria bacterium]
MVRYKILIEYDGTDFVGWQRQDNGFSVQQAIEKAITAFSGETVILFGAGRTDSGVHALGQVAHFDLERDTNANTVANALNFYLRSVRISILSAEAVNDGFDARISAKERAYIYKITNRRGPLGVGRGNSWWVPVPLDVDAMNEAAKVLIGNHDFTTFRATRCQASSPVKTLDELNVTRGGEVIEIRARARSFLHHQVRNIVGTLKLVGEGRWTKDDVQVALDSKKRAAGGPTAPPDGLYLVEVVY